MLHARLLLPGAHRRTIFGVAFLVGSTAIASADEPAVMRGTAPLAAVVDRSADMVAGIDRYLARGTDRALKSRDAFWHRDSGSAAAYAKSVEPNRERLRGMIGAVDPRTAPVRLEFVSSPDSPALVAEADAYRVYAVRWTVVGRIHGEGLLLEPNGKPGANIVAVPDADQTPEMLVGLQPGMKPETQFARRLAEAGCRVIVPALIDRRAQWSGNPKITMTNQTHREWVYRQGFEVGRHVIGYEVQKVLAAVDWFSARDAGGTLPVGVAGFGEGGLLALYSAALDTRVDAALVSGYFESRQRLWSEPIYRNVFGLLREFGDAEIASLIAPRSLIVEHSLGPRVTGPPVPQPGQRVSAAPGDLVPPVFAAVRAEVERAQPFFDAAKGELQLVTGAAGKTVGPGSAEASSAFLKQLGVRSESITAGESFRRTSRQAVDNDARQKRQVDALMQHLQARMRRSEEIRREFWKNAMPTKSLDAWKQAIGPYKKQLWERVTGKLPGPTLPLNARTRKIKESAQWTMYEVVFDVWNDVFAWGYLTIPKGIAPGERRPVVVCQHGLEGLPDSVVTEDPADRASRVYAAYAVRLAERGFITYAPHNPYRGRNAFRQLQRKANPLGLTLYSFILGQHERMLQWLGDLPFVDADRIGFYGLSYGGLSAMRIPSLLDGYALSISSACFNDWTRKIMSTDFRASYMFVAEQEHFSFDLGSTFNHAEMAALIAPRPFMVERGHRDGVAPDEWVAYEYAKVRRLYADLGVPERTTIEFFDGGHVINSQGTFEFLHRHLDWPVPHGVR
ncbi:MAG: hypothetical protein CMJ48_02900 [Planctomycetaceae bacterium]|nr:hypothetical protein [Planctomycetaceae bacterium]